MSYDLEASVKKLRDMIKMFYCLRSKWFKTFNGWNLFWPSKIKDKSFLITFLLSKKWYKVLYVHFCLDTKRTKKVKTAIFDVQLPFHALKRLNDSHTLTNLFYACLNGLKLVCKSYVDSKIRYKTWIWILKKDEETGIKTLTLRKWMNEALKRF